MAQRSRGDYDRFISYLKHMHIRAKQIYEELKKHDAMISVYGGAEEKEHYWTLFKLYLLAMYIPMFLQIAITGKEKGRIHSIVYIDTHTGPGLARVGPNEYDLVLGSPLLSLEWPLIISSHVENFRKISSGFDKYFFIDKDDTNSVLPTLRRAIRILSVEDKTHVNRGDINSKNIIRYIKRELSQDDKTGLFVFIDPLGDLNTQINYYTLKALSSLSNYMDIMYVVQDAQIARALSSITDKEKLRELLHKLYGRTVVRVYCESNKNFCSIGPKSRESIIKITELSIRSLGFRKVIIFDVPYKGQPIYHVIVATKGPGNWLPGYETYIKTKAPRDYERLRKLWLVASGRQRTLNEFF